VDEGRRKQHEDHKKGVIVWKKQEGADCMSCVHVFAFVFQSLSINVSKLDANNCCIYFNRFRTPE